MSLLDAAAQHPLLPTFALIALVYLTCLGGVLAAQLAWRGRTEYGHPRLTLSAGGIQREHPYRAASLISSGAAKSGKP